MSFQAYLDNIKAKTGKTPRQLKDLAVDAGVLTSDITASELVAWLKKDFGLGHGHSMAVWAVFKQNGWVGGSRRTSPKRRRVAPKWGSGMRKKIARGGAASRVSRSEP